MLARQQSVWAQPPAPGHPGTRSSPLAPRAWGPKWRVRARCRCSNPSGTSLSCTSCAWRRGWRASARHSQGNRRRRGRLCSGQPGSSGRGRRRIWSGSWQLPAVPARRWWSPFVPMRSSRSRPPRAGLTRRRRSGSGAWLPMWRPRWRRPRWVDAHAQTLAVRLEAERDRELQVVAARLVEEMVVAERDAKAAYERRMEEMRDAFTRDLDQMYEANTELRARATSLAQENGALRRKHREGLDRCERKWERKLATLQERHARLLRAVSAAGIRERRAGDSTECMPTDVDTQSGANGSLLANGVQMVGGQITSKKRHKKGHAADKVVLEGLTNGAGTCPTLPSIQRRPRGEPGGGGEAPCESSQASGPTTPHGRDADEDAHASAEAMSSEGGHRPSSGAGRHHRPPSGSSHHAARGGSEAQPSHARDGQGSWEGPAGDSVDGSGAQVDGGDAGSQEQERRRDADGDGHGGGAGHRGSSTDGSEGGSTGLDSDDSADSNYSAAKPSPFSRGQASLPHCRMEQGGVLCSEADSGGGTDGEEGGEGDEGEEGEEGVVGDEGEEGSGTEGEEQGGGDDAEQQLEALMLHRLSRKDDAIRALENRVAQLEARLGQEVAALLAAEEQMALLRHELGQLTDAANERDRALVAELAILESILKRLLTSRDCLIYTLGQDVLGMEKALAHANRVLKDTLHEIGTGMVV
eukprot:jgi/Mesvir1/3565/Mv12030-RA.3